MRDYLEFVLFVSAVVILIIGLLLGMFLPIAYLEGSAKAQWLEETRGIELPWYQAAFLDFEIGDHQIDLDSD